MLFYWLDAREAADASVYLFGRLCTGESACVVIRNIERTVFFAPRAGCSDIAAVREEAESVLARLNIRPSVCKVVRRRRVFECCEEQAYVKVQYPPWQPHIPDALASGVAYSHVYGRNAS